MRRLDECTRTAAWIAEQVKEHWPDAVVNLGDTFDSHSSIDVPSLCTGVRIMNTVMKACKSVAARFVIIPGNHDAYSRDYSALEAFQGIGADVAWKPTVYDDIFGAMPYCKSAEMATTWLKDLESKCHLTLVHLDVQGASYFSGYDSDVGIDPEEFEGPIYGGHYHHPHTIGPIELIGSVMHHNFTDSVRKGAARGILVLEVDDEGNVVSEERIANPHTTIYHKVNWTKEKAQIKTIRLYGKFPKRMHLRVQCEIAKVKEVKEEIAERFPELLSLAVIGMSDQTQEIKREATVHVDANPEDAIDAYVKNKGVPKGLDKDELLALGKEFLNDVVVG